MNKAEMKELDAAYGEAYNVEAFETMADNVIAALDTYAAKSGDVFASPRLVMWLLKLASLTMRHAGRDRTEAARLFADAWHSSEREGDSAMGILTLRPPDAY